MKKEKFESKVNNFKRTLAHVSDGLPVKEFKEYKPPKALLDQIERCRELTAWPSRFS